MEIKMNKSLKRKRKEFCIKEKAQKEKMEKRQPPQNEKNNKVRKNKVYFMEKNKNKMKKTKKGTQVKRRICSKMDGFLKKKLVVQYLFKKGRLIRYLCIPGNHPHNVKNPQTQNEGESPSLMKRTNGGSRKAMIVNKSL